jgi:hypothetical protein
MTQKTITNQYKCELHSQIINLCNSLELPLHDNVLGSKVYTNYQRVALIILQMRSGKALRKFVNELVESKWPNWLGLKELVTKSTLHRWIKKFRMDKLRIFLDQTTSLSKPKLMAIDATGFDSWQRSRHYENRLKQFGVTDYKMPFAKVDLLIDTHTKLVHDFVVRTKPRHDVLGAKTMFNHLKHKDVPILADRGYDSEPLHQLAFENGNLMYAPIRDFKVNKPKGRHRKRCQEGNEFYPMRNIVESVNFSLKSRFRGLRSKIPYMKKREFGWKVITYNLEMLAQAIRWLVANLIWDTAGATYSLLKFQIFISYLEICISYH